MNAHCKLIQAEQKLLIVLEIFNKKYAQMIKRNREVGILLLMQDS
jgi:hypothetical protein